MERITGPLDATGKTFGIVVARWNDAVTKLLLDGALDALRANGDPSVVVVDVPGCWEMPVAARALIERREVDAVIALGCILQGETAHAEQLARDVGAGLMALQVQSGVPVAWGILTPNTPEQALDRAGLKHGNKGREAAMAAIETVNAIGAIGSTTARAKLGLRSSG